MTFLNDWRGSYERDTFVRYCVPAGDRLRRWILLRGVQMTTWEKLDRLAELQAQIDVIRLHYDELRDSILTPEIREQLAEIDSEATTAIQAASAGLDQLTNEIKAEVIAAGATVKGGRLQAIWTKGRVSWDTKALDGYAAAHPEIMPFRKEGEPSVSIRGVK